jgi:hypothetical protein
MFSDPVSSIFRKQFCVVPAAPKSLHSRTSQPLRQYGGVLRVIFAVDADSVSDTAAESIPHLERSCSRSNFDVLSLGIVGGDP